MANNKKILIREKKEKNEIKEMNLKLIGDRIRIIDRPKIRF